MLDAWGTEDARKAMTRGLGQDYDHGRELQVRERWATRFTPRSRQLRGVRAHRIGADANEAVHVGMPANPMRVVDNRQMHNICVQDMVTAALVLGGLSLRDRLPRYPGDPTSRVRGRITPGVDPDLQRDQARWTRRERHAYDQSGRRLSQRVDWPRVTVGAEV